jgi:hypothetical protein
MLTAPKQTFLNTIVCISSLTVECSDNFNGSNYMKINSGVNNKESLVPDVKMTQP